MFHQSVFIFCHLCSSLLLSPPSSVSSLPSCCHSENKREGLHRRFFASPFTQFRLKLRCSYLCLRLIDNSEFVKAKTLSPNKRMHTNRRRASQFQSPLSFTRWIRSQRPS